MTNPVTPSQFYWTGQAIEALADLMPEATEPREVVAAEIEKAAARAGKSCIQAPNVYAYFGYCNSTPTL